MDAFEAASLPDLAPSPVRKYFTIDEAGRALFLVRRVVADVVRDYRRLHELRDACRALDAGGRDDEADDVREQFVALTDQLSSLKEELDQIGCELKDFRLGLVDFPAWHDGREVCLCWRHGEEAITHWHEVNAGFAGRRRIVDGRFD